jgi:hypothetical protein
MMQQAPDTHRMGRIVLVGGATITHRFGADLGNLDLRSAARTGPGYHDPAYELGADYPEVFVRWTTQAHLRLFTRWLVEGKLNVKDLITDRYPVEDADRACYDLLAGDPLEVSHHGERLLLTMGAPQIRACPPRPLGVAAKPPPGRRTRA